MQNLVNIIIERYLSKHSFFEHSPRDDVFMFLWLRRKYHDCERDRLYSAARNSRIVRDGFPSPSRPFSRDGFSIRAVIGVVDILPSRVN